MATPFAALEVATGKVTDACYQRHRHPRVPAFLKQVTTVYARMALQVVCDNYAVHKRPAVTAWLARNPRITIHFTPTPGSWPNLVEVFFEIIARQAISCGTFTTIADLEPRSGSTSTPGTSVRSRPLDNGRRHHLRQGNPREEPKDNTTPETHH